LRVTEIDLSGLVIVGAVASSAPLVLGLVPAFRLPAVVLELVLDEHDDAMDVFHHPYAYAAHRGLEFGVVPGEEELVAA